MRVFAWVACGAMLLGTIVGCSDSTSPSTGQVQVLMTDTPLDLATVNAVNVTIEEFRLYPKDADEESGGIEMEMPAVSGGEGLTLNLLDLQNGETALVAALDVPPGEYNKLRLLVTSAELTRDDPNDPALEIVDSIFVPSGKVDVPVDITVIGGDTTEVTLDFDASLSVQVNETPGGHPFILRPVIVPVRVE